MRRGHNESMPAMKRKSHRTNPIMTVSSIFGTLRDTAFRMNSKCHFVIHVSISRSRCSPAQTLRLIAVDGFARPATPTGIRPAITQSFGAVSFGCFA